MTQSKSKTHDHKGRMKLVTLPARLYREHAELVRMAAADKEINIGNFIRKACLAAVRKAGYQPSKIEYRRRK